MVILMTSSSSSKTEFTCFFYDVFDVGGFAGSSRLEVSLLYFVGIPFAVLMLLVVLYPTSLNAQFGAHMQKLWQFWFPVEYTCFRGSGFRMGPAIVPRYPAVVSLRSHRRQYRSAAVVPPVGPQQ